MTAYVPGISETDLKKIVLAIQQLAAGRPNATGSVTLTTGSATTTVTTANCAVGSTPILTPASTNAAVEVGNGTMFISAVTNGAFTIRTRTQRRRGGRFFMPSLGELIAIVWVGLS